MRINILAFGFSIFFIIGVPVTSAMYAPITIRYKHHIFSLDPDNYPEWRFATTTWEMNGEEILPDAKFRVDGDTLPVLPDGMRKVDKAGWNEGAIQSTIFTEIAFFLDKEPCSVKIDMDILGNISFTGEGLLGRRVDLEKATALIVEALRTGTHDILLPVLEIQPEIDVRSSALEDLGIKEVLSIGESNFRGSPYNRKHNIAVGLNKFNGTLIESGAIFSFNEILGPVGPSSGYKQELVIKGDKTLPDYGGGLCQVSTTAYRGMWEYGFPILQRTNHSYSVRYYYPQGTDATIYPPYKDVRFLNDTGAAVLLQTYTEDDKAYFIYYGTSDARKSEVFGPFVWAKTFAPEDKIEYTTDIPVDTERKVGERVPGLKAAWFRLIQKKDDEESTIEPTYSHYEARPRYTQIGVEEEVVVEEHTELNNEAIKQ